jgi:transposase
MCADAGYIGEESEDAFDDFLYTTHIRPRGEQKKQLKKGTLKKARRWVIERFGSWINRFRALLIRWNKKVENYYALLSFACGIIVWRSALYG